MFYDKNIKIVNKSLYILEITVLPIEHDIRLAYLPT